MSTAAAQKFNIFEKPTTDNSIVKSQFRTYHPYIKAFGNRDIVEITIHQSDGWIELQTSFLVIEGKLDITGNGTVKLVNNAGAFLFDSVEYELYGHRIEYVRDPGRLSAIRGFLCYDPNNCKDLFVAGWSYPQNPYIHDADKSFKMVIPLKHLFAFFNVYEHILIGKHTIRLVRALSDNSAIQITGAPTVQVKIDDIHLKVKHITPNDSIKYRLMKTIQDKPNAFVTLAYRKWELHELPSLKQGSTREIWTIKTCSDEESPRFVIVAFQTDRHDNSKNDPNIFDSLDISNIRLTMNSDYWPTERMKLNFSKGDYGEAYLDYVNFNASYANQKHPMLDYTAFKTHCLFVIDCSHRDEKISTTVDVKLDIESKTGFPDNTRTFCIVIYDHAARYYPHTGIVQDDPRLLILSSNMDHK